MESKFSETKQRLSEQVERLTQENNNIVLDNKVQLSDLQNQNSMLRQQIEELSHSKVKSEETLKQIELEKLLLVESIETHYKAKIDKLEEELSEANSRNQETMDSLIEGKGQDLAQMKQLYEQERIRIELRLAEEVRKSKLKIDQLNEEHEDQLKEEQENHEEEIESLQDHIKEIQAECELITKEAYQELAMSKQQIDYLDASLKDAKSQLSDYQKNSSETLNKQLENFAQERSILKTQIEAEYERKRNESERDKLELKDKIKQLQNSFDESNLIIQRLKEDFTKQELEFAREQAVLQQKNKFKDERIQELNDCILLFLICYYSLKRRHEGSSTFIRN